MRINIIILAMTTIFLSTVTFTKASETDGTISSTNRYAWNENTGWIDFGSSYSNVHVTDTGLTGYAWNETTGWIVLNCEQTSSCATVDYGVDNDAEGNLSGYAWSENLGWVLFSPTNGGVTIDSDGVFHGYAWSESSGWIIFNCLSTSSCGDVSYYVETDWRPASVRSSTPVATTTPPTGGGGGGGRPNNSCSYSYEKNPDITNDGKVGIFDFNQLMVAWGVTGKNAADIDQDCVVGIFDFNQLMVSWS